MRTGDHILTDIINCGRVARGEKFEYKYYKSYIEIESKQDEKIIYLDNTMYKPEETNMNNFGMFEGYTHFANIIIVNINDYEEKLDEIRKIINESQLDGGASLTQNNDISIKVFAYNSDKLINLSNKISDLIIKILLF